jgi:hypothetical protein
MNQNNKKTNLKNQLSLLSRGKLSSVISPSECRYFKITPPVYIRETQDKTGTGENKEMSHEGDTFWVSLIERFFGLILIIIGAVMLYFTATTPEISGFGTLFGVISVIVLIIGVLLLIIKPQK